MVDKELNLDEFVIDDKSSEGSKFNVNEQPSDVIEKFATIGKDYAGSGFSSPQKGGSKKVSQAEVRNDSYQDHP